MLNGSIYSSGMTAHIAMYRLFLPAMSMNIKLTVKKFISRNQRP